MSRIRVHASAAERQRAYRLRLLSAKEPLAPVEPHLPIVRRAASRPTRLATLQADAQRLQQEYEHWLEVLPEPLQDTDMAARLAETIEQLAGVVDLIAEIQLPRGFGRDS